jgi:D-glycerate 3-kinase
LSPEALIVALVAEQLAQPRARPLVVGLCGAQGSGKSTIAAALVARFPDAATLSLDDLYLSHAARMALARELHPLFATRGVPGTHDIALGLKTFAALDRGEPVSLPRFDKAQDDPVPSDLWPAAPAPCRLLVFEGWCVGAAPEADAALDVPVNALERDEDARRAWRRASNAALAGAYQALFARIDVQVLLAAPDIATVIDWRRQQERALRSTASGVGVMDDRAIARFVAHYERLTRHILAEMPGRADLTIPLAADRTLRSPPITIDSARREAVSADV